MLRGGLIAGAAALVLGVAVYALWPVPGEPLPEALPEGVVPLPSGGQARLQEVLTDRPGEGLTYRFRFVQDGFFVDEARFEAVMADLEHLCNVYAVPRLSAIGPKPGQLVISLAAQETVFAEPNPDIPQVFEIFSVENGTCIWEEF